MKLFCFREHISGGDNGTGSPVTCPREECVWIVAVNMVAAVAAYEKRQKAYEADREKVMEQISFGCPPTVTLRDVSAMEGEVVVTKAKA